MVTAMADDTFTRVRPRTSRRGSHGEALAAAPSSDGIIGAMPEVHLPRLEETEEPDEPAQKPSAASAVTQVAPSKPHRRSLATIALEVVLISAGVFLGLAGEQWRESARHRELAEMSLHRFRSEIVANRKLVADVKDYHVSTQAQVKRYIPKIDRALGQ